jgi:quercetin dioxygenase-like cupin family protein
MTDGRFAARKPNPESDLSGPDGETLMLPRDVVKMLTCALISYLVTPVLAFEDPAVRVDPLAKSVASWNGTLMPAYPAGQPEVTILRFRIAPGARLPMHKHPVINAGVMLAGELTVITEKGQTLHLKAGDPIIEVVEQWHYGHNQGADPVELIIFYAGVQGQPITVKQ